MLNIIFSVIQKKLIEKFEKKEIDIYYLIEYKKFLKGDVNDFNFELARRYFVEANSELKFFKLSKDFESEKHFVIKQLIKNFVNYPKQYIEENNLDKKKIDIKKYTEEIDSMIEEENLTKLNMDEKGNYKINKFDINNPDIEHPEIKDHAFDLVKNLEKQGVPINTKTKRALKFVEEYKKNNQ